MASSVLNDSFRKGGRDLSSVDFFWPIASQFILSLFASFGNGNSKALPFFLQFGTANNV